MADAVVAGATRRRDRGRGGVRPRGVRHDGRRRSGLQRHRAGNAGELRLHGRRRRRISSSCVYYPLLDETPGLPYALFVKASTDGEGAVRSIERIVAGLRWKLVAPPVVVAGDLAPGRPRAVPGARSDDRGRPRSRAVLEPRASTRSDPRLQASACLAASITESISREVIVGEAHAAAAAFASTCSGFVAPAITLATVGRARSHAIASSSKVWPRSRRPARRALRRGRTPFDDSASSRRSAGMPASRVPAGGASSRRYFPVSTPLASGKYGMNTTSFRARVQYAEPLRTSPQQAVLVLHAHEPSLFAVAADPCRLVDLIGREIAAADLEHFPVADQGIERGDRLLERRRGIRKVQLVEVDPIGAEPAKAVIDRSRDVRRARTALAVLVDRPAELRRDDGLVAARAEQRPRNSSLSVPP